MELIDKQDAIKVIDDVLMEDDRYKVWLKLGIRNLMPVVDARIVRHGRWLDYLSEGLKYKCSECGSRFDRPYNYCPCCGAKMGGQNDTD